MTAKRKLMLGVAILLMAVVTFTVWIVQTPDARPVVVSIDQPATLKVDSLTADLGDVKTDGKAEHTFHLANEGGERLKILDVDASCGCTVAEPEKTMLAPGETTTLKVTMDTSIKLGPVTKTITLVTNDPKTPKTVLTLTANVMQDMSGHNGMPVAVKDPLILFKGKCAECHVNKGIGKTGQALFQADCGMCHGMTAQGNVAMALVPQNYEDPAIREHIRTVITNGSPHTPTMPPFLKSKGGPLSEDEIESILNYLAFQSEEMKAAAPE